MSKMLATLEKLKTASAPPAARVIKLPLLERVPDPSGEPEKTFPELQKLDYVVRWGLPFEPRPARWDAAHSGHVFVDTDGTYLVVDANSNKAYYAYRLEDVVLLTDENTPRATED